MKYQADYKAVFEIDIPTNWKIKKKNTQGFDNEQHVQRKEHKSFRDMRKNKRNMWQGAE